MVDFFVGRSRVVYQLEILEDCGICGKFLIGYFINYKCKIIKVNVEICQISYCYSFFVVFIGFSFSGL